MTKLTPDEFLANDAGNFLLMKEITFLKKTIMNMHNALISAVDFMDHPKKYNCTIGTKDNFKKCIRVGRLCEKAIAEGYEWIRGGD
jgi:hypothetical protein